MQPIERRLTSAEAMEIVGDWGGREARDGDTEEERIKQERGCDHNYIVWDGKRVWVLGGIYIGA